MEKIIAKNAPDAVGPYSHAVSTGDLVFCSGQIPLVPGTMKIVEGEIKDQTLQVFKNITAVLKEAGLTLDNVVKSTVFLKNMDDFADMNTVYEECFGEHKPARSAFQVAKLPMDVLVEIECIASRG